MKNFINIVRHSIHQFRKKLNERLPSALREVADKGKKCIWWMPWVLVPMKDVLSCDKLREAAEKRYTRRCPNGEI